MATPTSTRPQNRLNTSLTMLLQGAVVMALGMTALPKISAAQTVDQRRYNVQSDAPRQLQAPLEARRRDYLRRMQANPADLDAAFAYAQVSARLGDLEGAIATYERMLIRVPNASRIQLELGALYFRLGAYKNARANFEQVLARPDTPEVVRRNVSTFMMAMKNNRKTSGFSGRFSYGLRYQSNANAGPNSDTVWLHGLEFVLDDMAKGTSDISAVMGLSLAYLQPLQYRGVAMQYNLEGAMSEYRDRKDISTTELDLRAGPVFLLDRYGIKGGRLTMQAVVGGGLLGHSTNYLNYGFSVGVQAPLNRRMVSRVNFDYRNEDYRSTHFRPRSDELTGERFRLNSTVSYQFARDWQGIAGLGVERRTAMREDGAYWEGSLQLGVSHRYDAPFDLTERPWTTTVLTRVARRVNDGPNRMVSLTEKQKGNDYYIQLIQNVPLRDNLALQVIGGYRSVKSNYDIRTFHDASFGASIVHSF